MRNEALADLHSALIDANEGYERAVQDAEDGEVRALFEKVRGLHERAHEDLHAALLERGEQPDDSGTFMSVVHKAVISVRSAITGIDEGSLSAFAKGEERIAEKYDDAIDGETDAATVAMLERHRKALSEVIAAMRSKSFDADVG